MSLDQRQTFRWSIFLVGFLLWAFPHSAEAHSSIKSLGEFPNGLIHPLTVPCHVLIILGMGLLLGQQNPPNFKILWRIFTPVSAGALLFTLSGFVSGIYQPILISIALLAGVLVAIGKPLPHLAYVFLFGVAAIGLGLDSGVDAGSSLITIAQLLFGTWISLSFLTFDVAYYVSKFNQKKWQQIGIRVIGSWIIAISFLVLAFFFKKHK